MGQPVFEGASVTSQRSSRGMITFVTVWLGQVVSLVGSGLTSFALGVWVFERTGSATAFAPFRLVKIGVHPVLADIGDEPLLARPRHLLGDQLVDLLTLVDHATGARHRAITVTARPIQVRVGRDLHGRLRPDLVAELGRR